MIQQLININAILLLKIYDFSFSQSEEPEDTKTKLRVTMVGWTLDDDRVITAVSDHTIKVWNSYNGNLCNILKVCFTVLSIRWYFLLLNIKYFISKY